MSKQYYRVAQVGGNPTTGQAKGRMSVEFPNARHGEQWFNIDAAFWDEFTKSKTYEHKRRYFRAEGPFPDAEMPADHFNGHEIHPQTLSTSKVLQIRCPAVLEALETDPMVDAEVQRACRRQAAAVQAGMAGPEVMKEHCFHVYGRAALPEAAKYQGAVSTAEDWKHLGAADRYSAGIFFPPQAPARGFNLEAALR